MFYRKNQLGLLAAAILSGFQTALAADCVPVVERTTPPTNEVALASYSYCGGLLDVTVYIENVNYNKIVTLYYTNGAGVQNPLTAITLGYQSSMPNTNYESWTATDIPVYIDGITELLNITYQALDIKQVYYQVLDEKIVASGDPAPGPASPPAPYATPLGKSKDITQWLAPVASSEAGIAKSRMFNNINIPGAALGTVIAAQSYTAPNYAYNWVRDSSLTMDVVVTFYAAATDATAIKAYETILFEYAHAGAVEQNDPDLITGLGEPKFNLNNTAFTGPWGRPQNDGPATRAITLIEFATAYLAKGGDINTVKSKIYDSTAHPLDAPVMKDLLFVASNWTSPSFDLWEEEQADHFYTRIVQRRALVLGAAFATKMGDSATANKLLTQVPAITASLSQFWDQGRNLLLYEYGPVLRGKASYKDIAVVLGVIHGYAGDGVYGYTNDEVLATAFQIATSFLPIYAVAKVTKDSAGLPLGIPIGRYPEDVYNGDGTSEGNPWYLCTASMAELFYRAATYYRKTAKQITVTSKTAPFWNYFAPSAKYKLNRPLTSGSHNFDVMIDALIGQGDAFMRRIKFYTPADGHLSEEFDRTTGQPVGAADLTWSYAALLTASFARAETISDRGYTKDLANVATTIRT